MVLKTFLYKHISARIVSAIKARIYDAVLARIRVYCPGLANALVRCHRYYGYWGSACAVLVGVYELVFNGGAFQAYTALQDVFAGIGGSLPVSIGEGFVDVAPYVDPIPVQPSARNPFVDWVLESLVGKKVAEEVCMSLTAPDETRRHTGWRYTVGYIPRTFRSFYAYVINPPERTPLAAKSLLPRFEGTWWQRFCRGWTLTPKDFSHPQQLAVLQPREKLPAFNFGGMKLMREEAHIKESSAKLVGVVNRPNVKVSRLLMKRTHALAEQIRAFRGEKLQYAFVSARRQAHFVTYPDLVGLAEQTFPTHFPRKKY